jgi:hypothetical protein
MERLVSGTSPEGTSEELFLDVESGLLPRRHIEEQTLSLDFRRADFEDYRETAESKRPMLWGAPVAAARGEQEFP